MPSHGRVMWRATPRLSRRRALLVSGAGAVALAAACRDDRRGSGDSKGPSDAGASSAPSTPTAEEPAVAGGILNQRIATDPTLDPHQATSSTSVWPTAPCFNQLVQFDPTKPATGPEDILPDLAERWEQPDPTTLIFSLRQGVTFHDGAAFSSQDPRVQLEWMLHPPEGKPSPRRGALLTVDAIETPDPHTLRIRLKQPAPSLLMNLASHFFAIGQARDILTHGEVSARLIGTGPFKLRDYQRSSVIELERNTRYHIPGRPYLDGLKFLIAGDYPTSLADFMSGQYQIFYDVGFSIPDQERVKQEAGSTFETVLVPSTFRDPVFMNRRHRPYDDPRVRQAISLALDRDAAIKVIREGAGRRGGYMAPNGVWAISEGDLKRYEGYDKSNIEKARQLLQQAGVLTPFEASVVTRADAQRFGEFVKDQLGKIGISVRLTIADTATAQAALQRGDFDIGPWQIALPLDDPDLTFGDLATTRATRNWSAVTDPQVDALYEKQSQTLNFDERRKTVQDLERQALSIFQVAMVLFEDLGFARQKRVRNFVFQQTLCTNRRMENVWLQP